MTERAGHEDIWEILRAVLQRLDPRELVAKSLSLSENDLAIEGMSESLPVQGKLVVVAFGKASVPMATGAIDALGVRVSSAIAVTKAGIESPVAEPPAVLEIIESDHPVPTERSLDAGRRVRELVEDLGPQDTVLMLISGGGSALVEDLVYGITLDDLQQTTDHLLRAGATINELNAVRRRISKLKGGRLATAAAPATVVNLIVSDVLNSPLQDIASGPTVNPPETDETFDSVMRRPDLVEDLPESVRKALESQRRRADEWHDNVHGSIVLADAETAARAALDAAVGLGYRVQTFGFDFQGEAREFGRTWATIARHARRDQHAFKKPLAMIGSGEMTVTVRGDGIGGRNTEMALAAAVEMADTEGVTICSFATDGDDGLSECAGGIVDGSSLTELERAGIDPLNSLSRNDSASALRAIGAEIDIGSTGTNVNDIYLALVSGDAPD